MAERETSGILTGGAERMDAPGHLFSGAECCSLFARLKMPKSIDAIVEQDGSFTFRAYPGR